MGGIPGRFLSSFGVTMAAAIAVSLFVSFTLTPMLRRAHGCGVSRARDGERRRKSPCSSAWSTWFYRPVERVYMALLGFVLRRRCIVVLLCLAALATIAAAVQGRAQVVPAAERRGAVADLACAHRKAPAWKRRDVLSERIAREVREQRGVEFTLLTIGDNNQRTPNLASIFVRLSARRRAKKTSCAIMARIRKDVVPQAAEGAAHQRRRVPAFTGGGSSTSNVQYVLTGPDLDQLDALRRDRARSPAQGARRGRRRQHARRPASPRSWPTCSARKAGDLGVTVADVVVVAAACSSAALKVSTYEERGEQYEVHVRADAPTAPTTKRSRCVTVPSSKLGTVPLLDVVSAESRARARRRSIATTAQRQVTLLANVAPGYGESQILTDARESHRRFAHAARATPPRRSVARTSSGARRRTSSLAFALSFVFMYLILAAQFESWLHPVTILLSLPLTLPFALLSLLLFGQSLNIFSALGVLVLFGVVKKNAHPADRSHQSAARARACRGAKRSCTPTAIVCGRS